ncbi:MAG: sulfotransferase domain-containing protein [Acidobacteriota bacterium]|jgi:hypothetical protein|nr:sulfotransferase domain-containing protein [Acidobacteriota bacterium]
MSKIDLIIIGAQKSATTSLKNYLKEHPDLIGHNQLEFSYFADDEEYSKDFDEVFKLYYGNPDLTSGKKVIAKHAGLYYDEKALKRLYEHNPECKLVYLVRQPVDRTYSSYTMGISEGWLKCDFADIIEVLQKEDFGQGLYKFINLSLYSKHLKMIYTIFPQDSVKVYLFEELKSNPGVICSEIFKWLNVDSSFMPEVRKKYNQTRQVKSKFFSEILLKLRKDNIIKKAAKAVLPYKIFTNLSLYLVEFNKSKKKFSGLAKKDREFLREYFRPYNKELKELTGLDLDSWN